METRRGKKKKKKMDGGSALFFFVCVCVVGSARMCHLRWPCRLAVTVQVREEMETEKRHGHTTDS